METTATADCLRIALEELLRKIEREGDVDILREGMWVLIEPLMELEDCYHTVSDRNDRIPELPEKRNGYLKRR